MSRRLSERLAPLAFAGSVAVLATAYGVFSVRNGWFPSPQIALAEETLRDLSEYWQNDLGLAPTRHLVPGRNHGSGGNADGFTMHRPNAAEPGYVLVAGISPDQDVTAHAVSLYDGDGRLAHRWHIDYAALDPEGASPLNVMLHGMEVFEDGSLAVTFDMGSVLARVDACGRAMWALPGGYHHSITADGAGGLWSWRGDHIVRIDAENGEITREIDLLEDVVPKGEEGVWAIRTITEDREGLGWQGDYFHTNDVEPLTAAMADAFPTFGVGDLLISLREINLVAVIDPGTGRLRWWQHGPWLKQHDPDFQPDGTITVYDNGTGLGRSRILRVRPGTTGTSVAFESGEDAPFYSWRRGKHQFLPNGNILITEAERGRVFEVAPDGSLVWERDFPWDGERNLIVTEARHVPEGFFRHGLPRCEQSSERLAAATASE